MYTLIVSLLYLVLFIGADVSITFMVIDILHGFTIHEALYLVLIEYAALLALEFYHVPRKMWAFHFWKMKGRFIYEAYASDEGATGGYNFIHPEYLLKAAFKTEEFKRLMAHEQRHMSQNTKLNWRSVNSIIPCKYDTYNDWETNPCELDAELAALNGGSWAHEALELAYKVEGGEITEADARAFVAAEMHRLIPWR